MHLKRVINRGRPDARTLPEPLFRITKHNPNHAWKLSLCATEIGGDGKTKIQGLSFPDIGRYALPGNLFFRHTFLFPSLADSGIFND
jgi:hypothetical protein